MKKIKTIYSDENINENINENIKSVNEIEITINETKYNFSFEEAEELYKGLTDFFLAYDNEEEYGWELKGGIPPVYDLLEKSVEDYGYMNFQTKYEEYEIY